MVFTFSQWPLPPWFNIYNSGEEEWETNDGQDDGNKGEDSGSDGSVVSAIGGGGLIAGVAVAVKTLKPDVKIIGVEPEACPSFLTAMKAGQAVLTPTLASLADGEWNVICF